MTTGQTLQFKQWVVFMFNGILVFFCIYNIASTQDMKDDKINKNT